MPFVYKLHYKRKYESVPVTMNQKRRIIKIRIRILSVDLLKRTLSEVKSMTYQIIIKDNTIFYNKLWGYVYCGIIDKLYNLIWYSKKFCWIYK